MGRRSGSRNQDYDQTRSRILDRIAARIMASERVTLSFRELAQAAEVTPSTLRHYFADRSGVVRAVFERLHRWGLAHLAEGASADRGTAAEALRWFVGYLRLGWERGVGRSHALGLAEGLGERSLGEAYLGHILEPTLQAAEARIARHVAQGELGRCDIRQAALELVAPVVLALLHQGPLGGCEVRRLDVDAFLEEHVARFLRAYAPPG